MIIIINKKIKTRWKGDCTGYGVLRDIDKYSGDDAEKDAESMKEDDGRSIAGQTEVVSKKGPKTPTLPPMVCIGAGLPPLLKMVERIHANQARARL